MPHWIKKFSLVVFTGFLFIAAFFLVFIIGKYVLPLLIPFIIAMIIGFFMEPLVCFLQKRLKMARSLAVLTAMVFSFGGIGLIITMVITRLIQELIDLYTILPGLIVQARNYMESRLPDILRLYGELPPKMGEQIQNSTGTLANSLRDVISSVVQSLLGWFSAVPAAVTLIAVSLLATYFISRDRNNLAKLWLKVIPEPYGQSSLYLLRDVFNAFLAYLRAQAILISITTLLSIAGLTVIGTAYALTMGLLIGLSDFIPVLGPASIYIPWILWSLIFGSTGFGIKLLVLYVIVLGARQILETKVVSANLGLHPLATLAAMYIGLKTMGFVGVVLGPILLIALSSLWKAGIIQTRVK